MKMLKMCVDCIGIASKLADDLNWEVFFKISRKPECDRCKNTFAWRRRPKK